MLAQMHKHLGLVFLDSRNELRPPKRHFARCSRASQFSGKTTPDCAMIDTKNVSDFFLGASDLGKPNNLLRINVFSRSAHTSRLF
jgi:hypothetical protein